MSWGFRKRDDSRIVFFRKAVSAVGKMKGNVLTFMKTSPPTPLMRALKVDTCNKKRSNELQRAAKSNKVGSSWGLRAAGRGSGPPRKSGTGADFSLLPQLAAAVPPLVDLPVQRGPASPRQRIGEARFGMRLTCGRKQSGRRL